MDMASDEDHTGICLRRPGFTFVCELPRALGNVTGLEVRNGRVVADTDSGIKMILTTG
jgi:hypothetical protein